MILCIMNIDPKRVGIILYRYSIIGSSSHINFARLLAKNGYEVDIFLDSGSFNEKLLSFSEKNIHVFQINKEQMIFGDIFSDSFRKYRAVSGMISLLSRGCFFIIKTFSEKAANLYGNHYLHRKQSFKSLLNISLLLKIVFIQEILFAKAIERRINSPFNFFIGSESKGLIIASLVSEKVKSKVVYYNLELLLESECHTMYERIVKSIERELNLKCEYTIIPDASRADHLIRDNGIDKEKILFLPVSALGDPIITKSQYFHEFLGIDSEKKIVLHAGNIADWTCCYEIAQSAVHWPEPFVFVIHTWRTDIANDPSLERIKRLVDNRKIFLSTNPVPWDDLPALLSGADIGLAFYKNLGKNFYETGLSSNKIAQYLQVGLPVVTSDYPTFHEIIYQYRCGKCTNDLDLLGDCLEEIFQDYIKYRENAFTCFREVYNFSRNFEGVLLKIKDL